jgi:hypothetical protein
VRARVRAHHLAVRLPLEGGVASAAGACGLQDYPPGNAALSLAARVRGLTARDASSTGRDDALWSVWGPRRAGYVVPRRDAVVFTLGALPADDASLTGPLQRVAPLLARAGLTGVDAVRSIADAARDVLAAGPRTKGELSDELGQRIDPALVPWCEGGRARHPPDALFRLGVVAAGTRLVAHDPAVLDLGPAALTEVPDDDRDRAHVELARRFVRCFAPATPRDLADWSGIGVADARRRFEALGDELVPVRSGGRRAWLHRTDRARFEGTEPVVGVRLLPPSDEFLAQRDRASLVPDAATRRLVWRPLGKPGVILVDGALAATWRARTDGTALELTYQPLLALSRAAAAAIESEADTIAALRGTPVRVRRQDP